MAQRLLAVPAVVAAVALAAGATSQSATSWHFFSEAAHLLLAPGSVDGGGLDLYLAHPEFQFGPLSVVAATPFAMLPSPLGAYAAIGAAVVLGAVAALGVELTLRRMGLAAGRGAWRRARIAGELTLAIVWADVAVRTAHLDDAIALAAAAMACAAVADNRPALATAALTVAAAAKPWAIVFTPLVLVSPGRVRAARLGVVLAGVAATWLPFVVDEPGSVTAAGSFRIANAPSSALRALGVADPATPSWDRPVQLVLGLLLVFALVRRGRWPAVIMVGLAVRLMLDPGVHHYYTAGLVLGTLLWEGVVRPGRLPVVTVAAAVILEVTATTLHPSSLAGALRLVLTGGLAVAAFVWGRQAERSFPRAPVRGAGREPLLDLDAGTARRAAHRRALLRQDDVDRFEVSLAPGDVAGGPMAYADVEDLDATRATRDLDV